MTEERDDIDLPRFSRRIGIVRPWSDARATADGTDRSPALLSPFDGVLGLRIDAGRRPRLDLSYLVFASVQAGGDAGPPGRRDPGSSARPTPERPGPSTVESTTGSREDRDPDREPTVREVLRRVAGPNGEPTDPGSGAATDPESGAATGHGSRPDRDEATDAAADGVLGSPIGRLRPTRLVTIDPDRNAEEAGTVRDGPRRFVASPERLVRRSPLASLPSGSTDRERSRTDRERSLAGRERSRTDRERSLAGRTHDPSGRDPADGTDGVRRRPVRVPGARSASARPRPADEGGPAGAPRGADTGGGPGDAGSDSDGGRPSRRPDGQRERSDRPDATTTDDQEAARSDGDTGPSGVDSTAPTHRGSTTGSSGRTTPSGGTTWQTTTSAARRTVVAGGESAEDGAGPDRSPVGRDPGASGSRGSDDPHGQPGGDAAGSAGGSAATGSAGGRPPAGPDGRPAPSMTPAAAPRRDSGGDSRDGDGRVATGTRPVPMVLDAPVAAGSTFGDSTASQGDGQSGRDFAGEPSRDGVPRASQAGGDAAAGTGDGAAAGTGDGAAARTRPPLTVRRSGAGDPAGRGAAAGGLGGDDRAGPAGGGRVGPERAGGRDPSRAATGRGAGGDGTDAPSVRDDRAGSGPDDRAGSWPFPESVSLHGGGPDGRFVEALYRELVKKMEIERERRGG